MTHSDSYTVLVVCSANVCRSPLAALLLEDALQRGPAPATGVRILSCGHQADPGQPACADAVRWAGAHGFPAARLDRHLSCSLDQVLLASADLVLAVDRRARAAVVRLSPVAAERTFTLREAALLSAGSGVPALLPPSDDTDPAARLNGARGLTDLPDVTTVRSGLRPWHTHRIHAHDVPDAHQDAGVGHRLVRRLLLPAVPDVAELLGRR